MSEGSILVVNAGSSSLKFSLFRAGASESLQLAVRGQIDGIGTRPSLKVKDDGGSTLDARELALADVRLVGALLAGGLTSCAFLALLRFVQICNAAGDGAFARQLLLVMGLLSMAVAGVFMVRQRDYKRMLAYSSGRHMGILVFTIGVGGLGTFGALLHLVNNGLGKGVLFLTAGNLHRAYGSKSTEDVTGAIRYAPISGGRFLADCSQSAGKLQLPEADLIVVSAHKLGGPVGRRAAGAGKLPWCRMPGPCGAPRAPVPDWSANCRRLPAPSHSAAGAARAWLAFTGAVRGFCRQGLSTPEDTNELAAPLMTARPWPAFSRLPQPRERCSLSP